MNEKIKKHWNDVLEDDNTETGGTSHSNETLGEFILEVFTENEIDRLTTNEINYELFINGIKLINFEQSAPQTDFDYVAKMILEDRYKVKTDIENLCTKMILMYEGYLEDNNLTHYAIEDNRTYPQNLIINIDDLRVFINESGGLNEFDYYT